MNQSTKFKGIMFDLDGTLADTLADIAAASNHALSQLKRPVFEVPRYRYLAGQGLEALMHDALGKDHHHLVKQGCDLFRAYYLEHSLDFTRPYDGIPELLNALVAQGMTIAVLSNKPHPATQQVVRDVFGQWTFAAVQGHEPPIPLKPDPASGLKIANELAIKPEDWLYVGDTKVDMETAVAAGFYPAGVLWGFRDEPELRASGAKAIVSEPEELLGLL